MERMVQALPRLPLPCTTLLSRAITCCSWGNMWEIHALTASDKGEDKQEEPVQVWPREMNAAGNVRSDVALPAPGHHCRAET